MVPLMASRKLDVNWLIGANPPAISPSTVRFSWTLGLLQNHPMTTSFHCVTSHWPTDNLLILDAWQVDGANMPAN